MPFRSSSFSGPTPPFFLFGTHMNLEDAFPAKDKRLPHLKKKGTHAYGRGTPPKTRLGRRQVHCFSGNASTGKFSSLARFLFYVFLLLPTSGPPPPAVYSSISGGVESFTGAVIFFSRCNTRRVTRIGMKSTAKNTGVKYCSKIWYWCCIGGRMATARKSRKQAMMMETNLTRLASFLNSSPPYSRILEGR